MKKIIPIPCPSLYPTVIIANGEFPTHPRAMAFLEGARYLICCDGALNALHQRGIVPDVVVGDLDSIAGELKDLYADLLVHQLDQESNDLTKAVILALQRGKKDVVILGATGLREDHSLGNIFLLPKYTEMLDSVVMVSNYGYFRYFTGCQYWQSFPGQKISIFGPDSRVTYCSEQLEYGLLNRRFFELWEGSLNRSLDDCFMLEVCGGGTILFGGFEESSTL